MEKKFKIKLEEAEQKADYLLDSLFGKNAEDVDKEDDDRQLLKDYVSHIEQSKELNLDKEWLKFSYRRHSRSMLYAASVAVILILAILIISNPGNEFLDQNLLTEQEVIMPVDGVVTLKLAGGKVVSLDSVMTDIELVPGIEVNQTEQEIKYNKQNNQVEDIPYEMEEYNELYIPKGKSYSLILSDGTKVWLNAESSIRYPVQFGSNERRVVIDGEAFFDVTHDTGKPFIVQTNDYNVKVLGTKFNVNAYKDEKVTATTLVSGLVSVSKEGANDLLVNPGEQISFNRSDGSIGKKEVDVELFTSWVNNKLKLESMRVEDIFRILGRRYDIDVFFSDEGAKDVEFTGKIPLNDNLNVILDQISIISNIEFQIEKRLIVVRYKD